MAFTTGTATDHNDLLDDLRVWATGTLGWTQMAWTAGATVNDPSTLFLRGPGAGADKRTYVNIKTYANSGSSIYSWDLYGATAYDSALDITVQPGNNGGLYMPKLNLWNSSTPYWFFGNDRRIIVVAKTSTNYVIAYLGFFLPWGTPEQYPFPLYIAGDYASRVTWSETNAARRFLTDPSGDHATGSSGSVRAPASTWLTGQNHAFGAGVNDGSIIDSGTVFKMWPAHAGGGGGGALNRWGPSESSSSMGGGLDRMVPTRQGDRMLFPSVICPAGEPPLGTLDGAYVVPGSGLSAETTVTVGARTFRCFPNVYRNSGDDFVAIEEV